MGGENIPSLETELRMDVALVNSPKFSVMVFSCLGLLYLISCWIPNEQHRTLYEQAFLIQAVQQGATLAMQGDFRIVDATLQIRNKPQASDQRARLVIQFVQSLSILDQFTLEGDMRGPGEVFLRFGDQRQYSMRSNKDPATGHFFVRGEVIQDHFPELVILGPDPNDLSSSMVEIEFLTLHGTRYLSYGIWVLPWLILSFIRLLFVL